jgi:hypothetical protein
MSDESNQANDNRQQSVPTGQPVREPVRSQPVQTGRRPVDVRRRQETRSSNLGEYIKFAILAVVLLGTPVVIALLIPLIFGQIVPTVMGSNLPTDTPLMPGDQMVEPETFGTPGITSPGGPETGIGGEATPAGTPGATPSGQDPVVNDVLAHIVQPGDTLASIAREYGVTAEEIAAENNIQNPNEIFVGNVLIIPQPASQ